MAAEPRNRRSTIRRWADSFVVLSLYHTVRALPLDAASRFGIGIGRVLPLVLRNKTRRAAANLARALPECPPEERRRILRGVWDNYGRTLAEYPHLDHLQPAGRLAFEGAAILRDMAARGGPFLIFGAHLANWEVVLPALAAHGVRPGMIYRPPADPMIDRLHQRTRGPFVASHLPKGSKGGRDAMRHLQSGGSVLILVDLRESKGIPVPFFGQPAMTAPGLARLAIRYRCPALPIRVERLGGAHFRVTVEPPLWPDVERAPEAEAAAFMARVNAVVERWVRERPEQWFWFHRRWPKERTGPPAQPLPAQPLPAQPLSSDPLSADAYVTPPAASIGQAGFQATSQRWPSGSEK